MEAVAFAVAGSDDAGAGGVGGDAAFDAARKEHGSAVRASAAAAADQTAPPRAVVPLSGLKGKGIKALRGAINDALAAAEAET